MFIMSAVNMLDHLNLQQGSALNWFCPPHRWFLEEGKLSLYPDPKTDFWQRTHYGFQNDNGHFLFTAIEGDFVLTTKARFFPKNQYDQAGLMVRISPDFWLKTSIEFEPAEPNRLGAVVTRHGYSDWSTQDISSNIQAYQLRIRREKDDYIVDYRQSDQMSWSQIRMAHLENAKGTIVQCGLYACSPIDGGFKVQFDYLSLETPS
jgi:regulation of enolase protein 1 (concanavalin A-like superfamily)